MASSTQIEKWKVRLRFAETRALWARLTEGLEISELWGQFVSEAKATYGLYSGDVDWRKIKEEPSRVRRGVRSASGLFQALLMKLSPARRVLLLASIVLLILSLIFPKGGPGFGLDAFYGAAILFILLAMELADRVTMKRDLEIAREIQEWLVPKNPPTVAGLDIAFATRPQNTVAGDYYDAFLRPLPSRGNDTPRLLMVVADVAGKSVPAALLMATFQASLRALAATAVTLDEIATGLNVYCRAHSLGGRRFTTAFLCEVDPVTLEMRYINAGHNNPILRRATGEIERLTVGAQPFGMPLFTKDEAPFPCGKVRLQPGDLLFIFTDGVEEAVNNAGAEYGEERLVPCIEQASRESARETLQRVMEDVNEFVGSARQHDDITSLVLRVEG
jgi:sigma-B regulation protein RsbU (phosphoserine phosphatase)